jgi:hypothetical protein
MYVYTYVSYVGENKMTVYVTVIVVWKTDTDVGTATVSVTTVVTYVYLLGDQVTVDTATVTYV